MNNQLDDLYVLTANNFFYPLNGIDNLLFLGSLEHVVKYYEKEYNKNAEEWTHISNYDTVRLYYLPNVLENGFTLEHYEQYKVYRQVIGWDDGVYGEEEDKIVLSPSEFKKVITNIKGGLDGRIS